VTFPTDLRLGGPGDEMVLWVASMKNLVNVVKTLLEGGVNANVDGEWAEYQRSGDSAH